ncbi:MAG: hypothetical protein DMG65_22085 [Candidatus Angelobacter sp. Gp1-AA117]|nr:MAG: hypothetical protein DMG65_22085 [Candidatus Angelobacter sp. Gp1-AA117]
MGTVLSVAVDISQLSAIQLLTLHARIGERLRELGITRSSNNPTGDLAEYLFCKAFKWTQATKSTAHIDALGADGLRYQIKGRRLTSHNPSRQLSWLHDLAGEHFDYLAGVLFKEDFSVQRAALIPCAVVRQFSKFVDPYDYRFVLRETVWDAPGVNDVTNKLRAVTL